MGLPFGIIHHSIRLLAWIPERIFGLRAKRIQRQPPKRLCLCILFHARNHITFCQVIFRCFPGDDQHQQFTGRYGRYPFFYTSLFILSSTSVYVPESGAELTGSQRRRYIRVLHAAASSRPAGFAKNLHAFATLRVVFYCKKPDTG